MALPLLSKLLISAMYIEFLSLFKICDIDNFTLIQEILQRRHGPL